MAAIVQLHPAVPAAPPGLGGSLPDSGCAGAPIASAIAQTFRAPAGDIPLLDWNGHPIDCSRCAHLALREAGQCEPGHSCMQDAYARRIDRFFRQHRDLAATHLEHPYFEVRAIAARYCDVFHLPPMVEDEDETVRLQVALRVPQRLLQRMVHDVHREVRIRVAQRLDEDHLGQLLKDPDYEVRKVVARRLPVSLLALLADDADLQVRLQVAARVEMPTLWRMAADPAPEVRRVVAERVPHGLLPLLARDEDWLVRWHVASRADAEVLRTLADDPDAEVRARVQERLAAATPVHGMEGVPHG